MSNVIDMSKEFALLTVCGEDCAHCPNYLGMKQPRCEGCTALKGKPFWTTEVCPIYACTNKQGVDHCGSCKEFPCEQFVNHYDPNNSEGQRNAISRAGVLSYRAKHGDEKAAILLRKLGKPRSA
jgi:hypothetical protein